MKKNSLSLDSLHEHMDGVSNELRMLLALDAQDDISTAQLPAMYEALSELFGGWTAYDSDAKSVLRVPPKLINKFVKDFGPVKVRDASILASKLVSFCKSIEGEISIGSAATESVADDVTNIVGAPQIATMNIEAAKWILVGDRAEVKSQIAQVSILLDSIIRMASFSNLPEDHRMLTQLERAELIAILETALLVLKAPLLEIGLFSEAKKKLQLTGANNEKSSEEALVQLLKEAATALGDLISLMERR